MDGPRIVYGETSLIASSEKIFSSKLVATFVSTANATSQFFVVKRHDIPNPTTFENVDD